MSFTTAVSGGSRGSLLFLDPSRLSPEALLADIPLSTEESEKLQGRLEQLVAGPKR